MTPKKTTVADLKRLQVAYTVLITMNPEPCADCGQMCTELYLNAVQSPDARCLACFVAHLGRVIHDQPAT